MLQPSLVQVHDSSIATAVRAVAGPPESLLTRFKQWVLQLLLQALGWLITHFPGPHRSPVLFWLITSIAVVLLLAMVGRTVFLWNRQRRELALSGSWRGPAAALGHRDPWRATQELAARGDFTAAAHALYAALLEATSRREQIALHPSKTVGDYTRDLRRRSSAAFTTFRDFARAYEVVIYGLGTCDRARYERLKTLAGPIVQPDG